VAELNEDRAYTQWGWKGEGSSGVSRNFVSQQRKSTGLNNLGVLHAGLESCFFPSWTCDKETAVVSLKGRDQSSSEGRTLASEERRQGRGSRSSQGVLLEVFQSPRDPTVISQEGSEGRIV
jgi:hypothetical protein